jgi:hypothetical protein
MKRITIVATLAVALGVGAALATRKSRHHSRSDDG